MENREAYLMEKFGGHDRYQDFIARLSVTDADVQAVETAINKLEKKLLTYDLSKVEYIRAWAKKIFYRELGKAIKRERPPGQVFTQESQVSHVLSVLEYGDKYKETQADVDKLDGKLRQRMAKILMGYSTTEIAGQENVTIPAISKQVAPQLAKWHWNKEQVKKIRNAWLLEALKDIAEKVERPGINWGKNNDEHGLAEGDLVKLDAYHQCLYKLITTDPRTKLAFAKYTIDDMPELDNRLVDISKGIDPATGKLFDDESGEC